MPQLELDNLVRVGVLQTEPPNRAEFEGLVRSAQKRLDDALKPDNSIDSRFDLAYNAAHALALAALRWHGYRPGKRYIVFQALEHTLGIEKPAQRLLASCHDQRNRVEYGGLAPVDETLLTDLIRVARDLLVRVRALSPLAGQG